MDTESSILSSFSSLEERRTYVENLWREAQEGAHRHIAQACYGAENICRLEWAGKVPLIRFRVFDEFSFVNAAFTTRFGGVSSGYLGEMNLGFSRGDSEETVEENFRIICDAIGVEPEKLVLSDQVHQTEVKRVSAADACGETIRKKLRATDGLCTAEPGLCLSTSYADCVPLFFVDARHRAIASVHSGWRGTVGKIGAAAVRKMAEQFGSRAEELVAVIGPSICRSCYEVDGEVAAAFEVAYGAELAGEIIFPGIREGKYQLDLWAANFLALKEAGMMPEHIHVSGICTCCHPKLFYSHRASGGNRGNLGGFLAIARGAQ